MSFNRSKSEKCRAVQNRRWSDREPFWRGKILEQESEGISIEQFCSREKLCKTSFFKWRKRLFYSEKSVDFIEVTGTVAPSSLELDISYADGLSLNLRGLSLADAKDLLLSFRT